MIIENFKLDSVKILNEDIVIKYHTATDNAVQSYELKTRPPHPDFINTVNSFLTYYNRMFGFELFNEENWTTTVKGITIKDTKLQLTGMLSSVTGQMCSLNTPFFEMENEDLGFNKSDIDKLLENVRIESWKFIYEKKTSQTSLESDLFPPEEIMDGLKQVGTVVDANGFEAPIIITERESESQIGLPENMNHAELKQWIKLTILNRPTSKKYFGKYNSKNTQELQQLVDGYNEEDFRVITPE